ncbi:uncharacterized protein VP01_525g5 [Puccinia sorghi]|uniref:Uncharacterized protein n=1 Tax=Puccinia sorghi TaxID=27349 RepID=A0A0L6UMF3_9BASI|nr:uncharacterized protein VP01_525g5 [Puccinia sorghi]
MFANGVLFAQYELCAKGILGVEIDVKTQWNSTFKMMRFCLTLQTLYNYFCNKSAKTRPYSLSSAEWDHCRKVMNLLEPLLEATELLCTSKYLVLLVFIVFIQHL